MMILHIVLVAILLCNIHSIAGVYVQTVQVDWMEWIPNQMNMK